MVDSSRHPVWLIFALSAGVIAISFVVLAMGPRADDSQRASAIVPGGVSSAAASPGPGSAAAAGPQTVTVQMGDYYYQPADIVVQPGELQLAITNVARRRHTFNIQDRATGADLLEADLGANQSTTLTFTPPAEGTYRIYCNITDHAERGQVGTLTVSRTARS